jgi:peptidoglycan hydrolase-like protein with peptidoglycan-binding domain
MSVVTDHGVDIDAAEVGRRHRRGPALGVVGAVVLAGAGSGWWFLLRDGEAAPAAAPAGPAATAEMTRETIADTESWTGSLGHGTPTTVAAGTQGVITGLPAAGTRINRGSELYRLNEKPVIALLGPIPMYRELHPGDSGADVEQFERNLAALGYDGFTVDDEFTSYTAAAVRDWQDDLGVSETGVVGPSDVVFLPAGANVDMVHVTVGSMVSPGASVLDLTSGKQIVTAQVEIANRALVTVGVPVIVTVPGGAQATGKVTAATVVESQDDDGSGGAGGGDEEGGAADSAVEVEITLDKPVDVALLGAPVDVAVDVDERTDVLVVPVTALLALAEGGYGLEVVAGDGTSSIVPVKTGLFADGKVEVSGDSLREGMVVGVAGR